MATAAGGQINCGIHSAAVEPTLIKSSFRRRWGRLASDEDADEGRDGSGCDETRTAGSGRHATVGIDAV